MTQTSASRSWTVLELLTWTTEHFDSRGMENPRLNAELLLGHVLGLQRIMLYARFDAQPTLEQRAAFRELVRRRAEREPIQYVLGECEFYGRTFAVGPAVLVPRQETELVVEAALGHLPRPTDAGPGPHAADVGTGSGCIAVTLAAERPDLVVTALDASPDALAVARGNVEKLSVAGRVHCVQGDLTDPLDDPVDLVVANLPYIPTEEIQTRQPEVREHEPYAALDGGPDGLDVVRRMIERGPRALKPGGWLVLELGPGQAPRVAERVADTPGYEPASIETTRDAPDCERVFCVRTSPDQ